MRTNNLLLITALVVAGSPLSAFADSSHDSGTQRFPTIYGVVQDVSVDGDNVTIHLYREPYDVLTVKWLRVRTADGQDLYAPDLQNQDNVEIEGDLDPHNRFLIVHCIKLLSRIEHRTGSF